MRSLVKGGVVSSTDFQQKVAPLLSALRSGSLRLEDYKAQLVRLFDFECWRGEGMTACGRDWSGPRFFSAVKFGENGVSCSAFAEEPAVSAGGSRHQVRSRRRKLPKKVRPVLVCDPKEAELEEEEPEIDCKYLVVKEKQQPM